MVQGLMHRAFDDADFFRIIGHVKVCYPPFILLLCEVASTPCFEQTEPNYDAGDERKRAQALFIAFLSTCCALGVNHLAGGPVDRRHRSQATFSNFPELVFTLTPIMT